MISLVLDGIKAIIIATWDKFAELVKAIAALVQTNKSSGS